MLLVTGEGLSEEAVAASTYALATAVLDQGAVSEDASLMRAAAQMYACAACIGTNAAAAQLAQSVCKDMAQTPLPARCLISSLHAEHLTLPQSAEDVMQAAIRSWRLLHFLMPT